MIRAIQGRLYYGQLEAAGGIGVYQRIDLPCDMGEPRSYPRESQHQKGCGLGPDYHEVIHPRDRSPQVHQMDYLQDWESCPDILAARNPRPAVIEVSFILNQNRGYESRLLTPPG